MAYEKLQAIEGGVGGCLNCGYHPGILPMNALICVGFGEASVSKDGLTVYEERPGVDEYWTVQDAENAAAKEPDCDWRIHYIGPLSERHYQRQGVEQWVLYEKGLGFA